MRTSVFDTTDLGCPASCHASTIEEDSAGDLWFACFAGTHEAHPDTSIWGARQVRGKWGDAKIWFKISTKDAHWNPVLFNTPRGMQIFFKTGSSPMDWMTWTSVWGATGWSTPQPFGVGIGRGPVRSKPILLSNANILAPCSLETPRYDQRFSRPRVEWTAHIERSVDGGTTWSASDNLLWSSANVLKRRQDGVIQPTIWESSPGQVHTLLRSTIGKICRSDSKDFGATWSPIEITDLPNPNSAIDVVKLKSGLLVLVYNHCEGNWVTRSPLSVAFSRGDGRKWSERIDIETNPNHNFAYPSLVAVGSQVTMTYTTRRKQISLVDFTADIKGDSVVVVLDGAERKLDLPQ